MQYKDYSSSQRGLDVSAHLEYWRRTLEGYEDSLELPTELFTPTFAVGRVAGWTAHALEQLAHGRLIRPESAYVGERGRRWTPVEEREPVRA